MSENVARSARRLLRLALVLLVFPASALRPAAEGPRSPGREGRLLSALPLVFEANRGQAPPDALYVARAGEAEYLFSRSGVTILWDEAPRALRASRPASGRPEPPPPPELDRVAQVLSTTLGARSLQLRFAGPAGTPDITGLDALPGKVNYFVGPTPSGWHTDVPTFGRIRYSGLYPGIDVVFYGDGDRLEFDLVVAPGSDPSRIRLVAEGTGRDRLRLEGGDALLAGSASGPRLLRPLVYQEVGGVKREIPGAYRLAGRTLILTLGDYDRGRPLIIDPVITAFATYLGGNNSDYAYSVAFDGQGNIYVAGQTYSSDFPVVGGIGGSGSGSAGFVTKLDPTGTTIIYSTLLKSNGSASANGIAVDGSGNVYVVGFCSSGFPLVSAAQSTYGGGTDAFAAKLNPSGNALLFSTFLGGNQWDQAQKVAVDADGNCVVAGYTQSPNFPVASAFQSTLKSTAGNGFVTRFGPSGNLMWSTYLGGSSVYGDRATGVAVDGSGNAYVTGYAYSSDFPTVNPYQGTCKGCVTGYYDDAFLAAFSTGGVPIYSTFFGGNSATAGAAVAVDAAGNAFLGGRTWCSDLPVTPGAAHPFFDNTGTSDAFVAVFNPAGSQLISCTYLGGNETDFITGLSYIPRAPGSGYLGVVGTTNSLFDNAVPAVQDPHPPATAFGTLFAGANNGQGGLTCDGFASSPSVPLASRIFPVDLNGDGLADIAGLVPSQSEVFAQMNTGGGVFGPPVVSATRSFMPIDGVVTDFNGDGAPDLVVACRQSLADPAEGAINILYGKPGGHFIPAGTEWPVLGQPVGVVAGDFNGDGIPDLVAVEQTPTGGMITSFLQDPTYPGDFLPAIQTPLPGLFPGKVSTLDYNHDGTPDLAVLFPLQPGGYSGPDSVGIFQCDGAGHFTSAGTLNTGIWPSDMAVADLNGDGLQDVAVLNYNDATLSIFQAQNPGPGFGSPSVIPTTGYYPSRLFLGNLHSPTMPDLIVTNPIYHLPAQIFANTSPAGGAVSFTRSPFSCQQQAFVACGPFFAPAGQSPLSDMVFLRGGNYDSPFKTILTAPGLGPVFSTLIGTGTGDTESAGIAVDANGQAFTVGTSPSGGIFPGVGARPFGGGGCDGFLDIEPPPTVHVTRCKADRYLGQWSQRQIQDNRSCYLYPPLGQMPAAFPSCPSPTVTIDPGDGSGPVQGTTLVHDYAPGTYDFTVTDDFGGGDVEICIGEVYIPVQPCNLTCTATPSVTGGCSPVAVNFTSTATLSPACVPSTVTTHWDFGDGSSSENPSASHTYPSPGSYTWTLTVECPALQLSCSKSGVIHVCGLTCSGGPDRTMGCAGDPFNFSASGTVAGGCNGTLTYTWDFGDGSGGTGAAAAHAYSLPGQYAWQLTVTGNGCTCTKSGTVCVVKAQAIVSPTAFAGCPASFSALGGAPACFDGTPVYTWAFGDGAGGTGQDATHAYAQAGDYTWTLTETFGNTTCTDTGTVHVCGFTCDTTTNPNPAAGFAPLTVTFAGVATITGGCGGDITYSWDFGNGTTGVGPNPAPVLYANPGSYTWVMTAKVNGCTCTKTGTVCVYDCSATGPDGVCLANAASFTASGLPPGCQGNITWAWLFGDGTGALQQNPLHVYPGLGPYNWSCTITINGVACTKSGVVLVCNPVCGASVPATGVAGGIVNYVGTLDAGGCATLPVTWAWTFGDGATANTQNAVHSYAAMGTYNWSLTVTVGTCTCTQGGAITIFPPCTLQCSANTPTVGMAGTATQFTATATPNNCGTLVPVYSWNFGDPGSGAANTSSLQSPTHTYATPGNYTWTMVASLPGTLVTCTQTGTLKVVAPPVVTLIKKVSPPFKLVVTGSNLQSGIKVFINGVEWTSVVWKNTGKIQLTGTGLKAAVPKGVTTTFRFLNPDGGEVTVTWSW